MARRQVNIYINGKEVAASVKQITSEKRKLVAELNRMTIGSEEYIQTASKIRNLDATLKQHRDNIRGVEKGYNSVAASGLKRLPQLALAAFSVDLIVGYGKELFRLGGEMELLTKKAETVFGTALPQVTAAAERNATAMGLTTSQYIDAAAAIGDLLIPMGFQREEAAALSTDLVNLSGALSEWTGGQVSSTEVSRILSKALLGEREELKQLGIAISEADVQARLAEKGMKGLTGQMLEQAKAAVTLELITEKSADAQTAFANNSDTLVRKQAELRAQFQNIKESIATALVPVFHRLLEAAAPVVEKVADFVTEATQGSERTRAFAGVLKPFIVFWQNLFKALGPVLNVLGKITVYLGGKLVQALGYASVKVLEFSNFFINAQNKLNKFLGIKTRFEPYDIDAYKKNLAELTKAREESKVDEPIGDDKDTKKNDDPFAPATDPKELERQRKEREKERERQRKEEEKEAERRKKEAAKAEEDRLKLLNEIAERYADAELEDLFRREEEKLKAREEFEQRRFDLEQEVQQQLNEVFLSDRELAILQLEEFYNQLKFEAEKYGVDTTELERARREEISRINTEYDQKDLESTRKTQQQKLQVFQNSFSALGSAFGQLYDTLAQEEGEYIVLQKAATLAQIAVDTAAAISSLTAASEANPTNALTFGAAGIAQFAAGIIRILSNIALAKQTLSKAPEVPQRKYGGFLNVTGEDDGRSYRAQYIGSPRTGMLPGRPVVLASEAGPEYFVSNRDLRNPRVFNYVRAIENIKGGRVPQFQEVGFTTTPTAAGAGASAVPAPGVSNELMMMILRSLEKLNDRLDNPLPATAIIPDETLVDSNKRFKKLNDASGGILG